MNKNAPAVRTLRRVIVATVAVVSIALVSSTAASDRTVVVAIIHPMQPIGNIDCCH
jgi:hypothetical protein